MPRPFQLVDELAHNTLEGLPVDQPHRAHLVGQVDLHRFGKIRE